MSAQRGCLPKGMSTCGAGCLPGRASAQGVSAYREHASEEICLRIGSSELVTGKCFQVKFILMVHTSNKPCCYAIIS